MNQRITNKPGLVKALQKPEVEFIEERAVYSDKALLALIADLKKLIKEGRQLHLVTLACD